jgi:hypothetical protein
MPRDTPTPTSPVERLTAIGKLLTSLDQRLVETFEALERIGEAASSIELVGADGSDLVADVKRRLARLDKRLNADLDEMKRAVLDKIGELDVADLSRRFDDIHRAIRNIEGAVTRVDATVEGAVDAAPDFVTRRVEESAGEIAKQLPGRT